MQSVIHATKTDHRFNEVIECVYDTVEDLINAMRYRNITIVIKSVEKVEPFSRCMGCGTKVDPGVARCWSTCGLEEYPR